MTGLIAAQQRLADSEALLRASLGHLADRQHQRCVSLLEEMLERIERLPTWFAPDEHVADHVVAGLTVAVELVREQGDAAQAARAADLLRRAVRLRLGTLR